MKIKEINLAEALHYCKTPESYFFDRKAFRIKPNQIEKYSVSFANADGGEIVIGIADDSDEPVPEKRWQGAKDIEEYNAFIQTLVFLSPSVDFKYTFLKCKDREGYFLLLNMEKGNQVFKTSDNTFYVRHAASSIPYKDPQKIQELAYAKGTTSYEDESVKTVATEKVVESNELKQFLESISTGSEALEYTINENLIEGQTFEPRVASVLLFGFKIRSKTALIH
jgi:ATP-dependent DNA helicase RecG